MGPVAVPQGSKRITRSPGNSAAPFQGPPQPVPGAPGVGSGRVLVFVRGGLAEEFDARDLDPEFKPLHE